MCLARSPRGASGLLAIRGDLGQSERITVINGQNDSLSQDQKKWIQMRKPVPLGLRDGCDQGTAPADNIPSCFSGIHSAGRSGLAGGVSSRAGSCVELGGSLMKQLDYRARAEGRGKMEDAPGYLSRLTIPSPTSSPAAGLR